MSITRLLVLAAFALPVFAQSTIEDALAEALENERRLYDCSCKVNACQ